MITLPGLTGQLLPSSQGLVFFLYKMLIILLYSASRKIVMKDLQHAESGQWDPVATEPAAEPFVEGGIGSQVVEGVVGMVRDIIMEDDGLR